MTSYELSFKIRLEGIDNDDEVKKGYVICDQGKECARSVKFDGLMNIQEYKSIIS